jgi:hypothetical protein
MPGVDMGCWRTQSEGAERMSVLEIKREIEATSDEERLFLLAYLKHLTRRNDPGYARHLARRAQEMDANKVSLDQIKRVHQALEAEGL